MLMAAILLLIVKLMAPNVETKRRLKSIAIVKSITINF
jgi:hypothetical protein